MEVAVALEGGRNYHLFSPLGIKAKSECARDDPLFFRAFELGPVDVNSPGIHRV